MNNMPAEKLFLETIRLPATYSKYTVKLAKNLLASTELSITEIAGQCGYANASKFLEVFKKNEGILPKDWRK